MKSGDKVTIKDGSYTRSIVDGTLVHEFLNRGEAKGRQYTIVEVGCAFPLVDQGELGAQRREHRNDTVIQDEYGKVVLIHSGFLKPVDPPHVWKHGDVFNFNHCKMIYMADPSQPGYVFYLVDGYVVSGKMQTYLDNGTFLFNIKSRL